LSKKRIIGAYRHLTFRNLLIACLAVSLISLAVSGMTGAVTLSTWFLVPIVVSAGSAVFFAYMIRNSRRIAYRDAVAGLPHHPQDFAATLFRPGIAGFTPQEGFLSWVTKDGRRIGGEDLRGHRRTLLLEGNGSRRTGRKTPCIRKHYEQQGYGDRHLPPEAPNR